MMNIIDRATKFRLTCDTKTEQGMRHFHCGHEYVEIGGIKWATMNIGSNSTTDYGLYFQWGDTKGYTTEQFGSDKNFTFGADYKYCDGTCSVMTRYNATDGKTVLEPSDDAVTAAWGNGWRMPTKEEFRALRNAVNKSWVTDYQGSGINGLVYTDKTDSSKELFFPAAGFAYNGSVYDVGFHGSYWSSSLCNISVSSAYRMYFYRGDVYWIINGIRYYSFPVRGVVDN